MEDIEWVAFGIRTALENSLFSVTLSHYKIPGTLFISRVAHFRDVVGAHFPVAPYYGIQPYAPSCRFFLIPNQSYVYLIMHPPIDHYISK